jgi:hypothetical protein
LVADTLDQLLAMEAMAVEQASTVARAVQRYRSEQSRIRRLSYRCLSAELPDATEPSRLIASQHETPEWN